MKHVLSRWIAGCLLVLVAARAESSDLRFSQTLAAEERASAGLARLSSDEVAVVDALVRRDIAARAASPNADRAGATFSARLTPDERRTAGLPKLAAAELTRLDALVDRHENGRLARTFLAPPVYLSRSASRVKPDDTKREREIHGAFSLSYGWGSGGYSEKTGSMVLNFTDPDRGYSVSVGYSESHVKGGSIYRDGYYDPIDPLRDPLRGGLLESSPPLRP